VLNKYLTKITGVFPKEYVVDPILIRTIVIISKFDNRINCYQLQENVSGGYDDEEFGTLIGYGNLRCYLENEIQCRYIKYSSVIF